VTREGDLYSMNFPAQPPQACALPEVLAAGLGAMPSEVLAADDYLAVFDSEAQVGCLAPDFSKLRQLDLRGLIATAPGDECDFVSRFFAPRFGIDEDPVTGSAHCVLAPYWSGRLGRNRLRARQISKRGGDVICEIADTRVILKGAAVTFLRGEITVPA
jgi:predicted PhzF superfamily epimerase YddE/YHI9